MVGVGLLENRSANRAILTYLGLALAVWIGSVVVVAATVVGLFLAADTVIGDTTQLDYAAQKLPTTTTTTTTTTAAPDGRPPAEPAIDPSTYGTDRPADLVDGTLFDLLTAQGAAPNQAVCTGEVLLSRVTQDELISLGITEFTEEALAPVIEAAKDCDIDQGTIDATVTAGLPG